MTETSDKPRRRIEPWALVPVAIIIFACIPNAIMLYLASRTDTARYDNRHYLRMHEEQQTDISSDSIDADRRNTPDDETPEPR